MLRRIIQAFCYCLLSTLFHLPQRYEVDAVKADIPSTNPPIQIKNETSNVIQDNSSPISSSILPPPDSVQLKPRIICFNIMVAGLSGLGKTTLCEALLESWSETKDPIDKRTTRKGTKSKQRKGISTSTLAVKVSNPLEWYDTAANTILRVRIIDTPGFGNKINHKNSVQTIMDYIQKCRKNKLQIEQSSKPGDYVNLGEDDGLVHICLYFLSPGRFLEIDRHFLKHVQNEIPILPIIAKADTLTDEEISYYRAMLKQTFKKENIQVYDSFDDDSVVKKKNMKTTSNKFKSNKYYRGRRQGESLAIIARDGVYPWGQAKSFDPNHSDLIIIRDLLLSEHTEKFLDQSQAQFLKYRARKMTTDKFIGGIKYAVFVGVLALQLSSILQYSENESLHRLKTLMKGLVGRILQLNKRRKKKSFHTLPLEAKNTMEEDSHEDEDSYQEETPMTSVGQSSFLKRFVGQKGIFCTPPYKNCFGP